MLFTLGQKSAYNRSLALLRQASASIANILNTNA